jgi:hypothetical protein
MSRLPVDSLPRVGSEDEERVSGDGARLLVIFRTDSPTCRIVMPLLETYFRRSEGSFDVVAVSQDDMETTIGYVREANLTMPVLVDHPRYRLSAVLAPTCVPVVARLDGEDVVTRVEGFDKALLRGLMTAMADAESAPWDPSYILADPSLPERAEPSASRAAQRS